LWKKIGPGFITGASDDDPSGIATYTQAGAAFGVTTLWVAWLSLPLMISIQEMCARIGLVQKKGLVSVIRKYYPGWMLYVLVLLSFPAITLNIGANIAALGAVGHMLAPGLDANFISLLFVVLLLWMMIKFSYKKIAAVLKWLGVVLLVYIIVPFLFRQDLRFIIRHSLIPEFEMTQSFVATIVGLLGTTISPYLFFWQASMEREEIRHKKVVVDKHIITNMQTDVKTGMIFSNLIMYFIILTAATVFYPNGIRSIDTVEDAAMALYPLAGNAAYLLFSLGIIGTGLLAIPVLAGSLSYMMAETFRWKEGLDKKFHEAKGFYITMITALFIGFAVNFIGISPVKALIYTAVIYGLIAPVLIAMILHICNSKRIMGSFVNDRKSNAWGLACLLLMTVSAGTLIYLLLD
jgi:NRAMP (natural resistance-associated macrophage protein)-like metal ion transporter